MDTSSVDIETQPANGKLKRQENYLKTNSSTFNDLIKHRNINIITLVL